MAIALFPLRNPITDATGLFWRNCDTHMHVVWHQMTLDNLTLLLPCQCVEDRTQLSARLPENRLPPPFRHENYVVLAVPLGMG